MVHGIGTMIFHLQDRHVDTQDQNKPATRSFGRSQRVTNLNMPCVRVTRISWKFLVQELAWPLARSRSVRQSYGTVFLRILEK